MITTDRLDDIIRAIRLLRKLAVSDREWANGIFGSYSPAFREKNLKRARRKEKGAVRLSKLLAKECDKLKKEYEPKVWGGQLLGWTTSAEVDALEESIKHDY